MAIFSFDQSYNLGKVREVDTRKVSILVNSDEDLRKAHVGKLVVLRLAGAVETWLVGIIDKVIKSLAGHDMADAEGTPEDVAVTQESVVNIVRVTLIGTMKWDAIAGRTKFSRSIFQVPEIDAECFILRDRQLENFMNVLAIEGDREHSLELGKYTLDDSATAFLDGNKLFQRHAALLGSTGSGKSWTVASILERAAKLPSSNLIVFDLHGEYRELSYTSHLRIPGPEDLGRSEKELLYLPY